MQLRVRTTALQVLVSTYLSDFISTTFSLAHLTPARFLGLARHIQTFLMAFALAIPSVWSSDSLLHLL